MKRLMFALWRFAAGLTRPSKQSNVRMLRRRGESLESLVIREAHETDIPALAELHVETWNATYAPLLKGPSAEVRDRQWREAFRQRDPVWCCFVVQHSDGRLIGFAQGGRSSHPDYGGELRKIYLLRQYQRLGLGRQLVTRVAGHFMSHGINSMWLFGDARNPSNRAWRALGAEKTDRDPGTGNYGWRDLSRLNGAR